MISRLTSIPHTTVVRWVKKRGNDIETFRPQTGEVEQVNVMELGEMWHFVQKKNKCWLWLAYDRDGQRVCGVQLGRRDVPTCQRLFDQLELFDIGYVCTDDYPTYAKIVPSDMHSKPRP